MPASDRMKDAAVLACVTAVSEEGEAAETSREEGGELQASENDTDDKNTIQRTKLKVLWEGASVL